MIRFEHGVIKVGGRLTKLSGIGLTYHKGHKRKRGPLDIDRADMFLVSDKGNPLRGWLCYPCRGDG